MGYKSRGAYSIGICLRDDCVNRTKEGEEDTPKDTCKRCFRFSHYSKGEPKS